MTRIFLAILYYCIAIPVIITAQKFFQTDLSGPGLNIFVFIVAIVLNIYVLFKSFRTSAIRDNESFIPVFIHLAGFIFVIYLIFFDQQWMLKH
jgi:hypothetical protein